MFRLAVLLALTAALPARAEYIPGSDFAFGNWEGAAYTFDETGRFSHCAISASFVSGDILHFSVNAQVSVSIGIESAGWGLTPGETFAITASIDRRRSFRGTAEALPPISPRSS
ncbi:MAG: hypothetical protein IE927_12280 [Rhodobacterales bacterium]|nr:hypothetical protein [Rhodobacterales bacterium]